MANKKRCTFYYKEARLTVSNRNLQELLTEVINQSPTVEQRIQRLVEGEPACRVLNVLRTAHGMVFGEMILYEEGKVPNVILMEMQKGSLPIEELALGNESEIRKELLESVMYFGVSGNHVVVIQSNALTARHLEYHLTWLLGEQSGILDQGFSLALADQISEAVEKKVRKEHVKRVQIGTGVHSNKDQVHGTATMPTRPARKVSFLSGLRGLELLEHIAPNIMEDLDLTTVFDESNLRVRIEVTYDRKTDTAGQQLMDDLAMATRHFDDDDVRIVYKDGSKDDGKVIKVRGDISIPTYHGMLVSDDLYIEIAKWLKSQIDSGAIQTKI